MLLHYLRRASRWVSVIIHHKLWHFVLNLLVKLFSTVNYWLNHYYEQDFMSFKTFCLYSCCWNIPVSYCRIFLFLRENYNFWYYDVLLYDLSCRIYVASCMLLLKIYLKLLLRHLKHGIFSLKLYFCKTYYLYFKSGPKTSFCNCINLIFLMGFL